VKARDIIPGWPRGKSTTQPTVPPLTFWEEHEGQWFEMVTGYFPSCDRRYHAQQQAMVDEYRAQTGLMRWLYLDVILGRATNRTACGADLR
jgi:hypothetical protein